MRQKILLAKNRSKGQVTDHVGYGEPRVRVYFPTGEAVYFPKLDTAIDTSNDLWIEIECDFDFAAKNVPERYLVAPE